MTNSDNLSKFIIYNHHHASLTHELSEIKPDRECYAIQLFGLMLNNQKFRKKASLCCLF